MRMEPGLFANHTASISHVASVSRIASPPVLLVAKLGVLATMLVRGLGVAFVESTSSSTDRCQGKRFATWYPLWICILEMFHGRAMSSPTSIYRENSLRKYMLAIGLAHFMTVLGLSILGETRA